MPDALAMLTALAEDQPTVPHNKGQCILAEFDVHPHPIKSGLVTGFQSRLEFLIGLRLVLVGMESHCIRAYYKPSFFDKETARFVRASLGTVDLRPILEEFRVTSLVAYGLILSPRGVAQDVVAR